MNDNKNEISIIGILLTQYKQRRTIVKCEFWLLYF